MDAISGNHSHTGKRREVRVEHSPRSLADQPEAAQAGLAIYVVNLDRSRDRWETLVQRLAAVPWPVVRVPALDASAQPQAVLSVRNQVLLNPPTGLGWNKLRERVFSLVEEACFCSHLAALQRFVESNESYAVILEDDAEPQRDIVPELTALVNSEAEFDIVKLEGIRHRGSRLALFERRIGSALLVRSLKPCSGAAAYLITRQAALRLLKQAGQMCVPFDDFINNSGLHGCTVHYLSPWLFWQSGAASTMVVMRAPIRYARRRDLSHFLLQAFRRGRLRVLLWCYAVCYPRLSLSLRLAQW